MYKSSLHGRPDLLYVTEGESTGSWFRFNAPQLNPDFVAHRDSPGRRFDLTARGGLGGSARVVAQRAQVHGWLQ
jgi:hypothetical protein